MIRRLYLVSLGSNHKAQIYGVGVSLTQGPETNLPRSRFELEQLTAGLTKHMEDGRAQLSNHLRGAARGQLPHETLVAFQRWVQAGASRTMWAEGAPSGVYGSDLSLAAMRVCDVSLQARVPCVSVFVKPRYAQAEGHGGMPRAEAATVSLLYSLVCQLARLLPPEFEATDELSYENFGLLDGSIGSAGVALRVIDALLAHAPPSLILVIDGINMAESSTTTAILSSLMDIIRSQEQRRILKVCFTTNGNSRVLIKATRVVERVDASRVALGGISAPLRAASDINELKGPEVWQAGPEGR